MKNLVLSFLVIVLSLIGAGQLVAQQGGNPSATGSQVMVNINTADADTLAAYLDGVGIARANAIVAYRSEHGPFRSVDDLTRVSGIGEAILSGNRHRLSIE